MAESLPSAGSSDPADRAADRSILPQPSTLTKEKHMIRVVVFVAGAVVGAIGTLVVQNPKSVAKKVREAVAFAAKKVREVYQAGDAKEARPADGPGDRAA